jgi:hypothetical protein
MDASSMAPPPVLLFRAYSLENRSHARNTSAAGAVASLRPGGKVAPLPEGLREAWAHLLRNQATIQNAMVSRALINSDDMTGT